MTLNPLSESSLMSMLGYLFFGLLLIEYIDGIILINDSSNGSVLFSTDTFEDI